MKLFWLITLMTLLVCISALLVLFRASLIKIRSQAIDSKKREQLRASKGISKLLDSGETIAWAISFCFVATTVSMGVLLYPLVFHAGAFFGIQFISEHFIVSLLLGGICFLIFIYFLHEVVARIAGRVFKTADVEALSQSMLIVSRLVNPLIVSVRYFSTILLKRFKVEASDVYNPLDATSQIRALGYPEASLSPELLRIVRNAIRLPELDVSDVMLPRNQIQFLDIDEPILSNIETAQKTGHTRFPLCQGGLDQCFAIIHIKDVFHYQGDLNTLDLTKFQKQLIRFPEETSLEDALKKFLKFKIHMALVVDAFGGITGLLTLEDILEELVGNIQDEFDSEDALIVPVSKSTYRVSGLLPIHELESVLEVDIPCDSVSTFGGLVSLELGRIPEKNERLDFMGMRIKVNEVSNKRLISATIRVIKSSELG